MAYLEELLPEFRKGAKIRLNSWPEDKYIYQKDGEIKENRGGCFYFGYNYMNCDGWELYQEPIDGIISSKINAFAGFGTTTEICQ